MLTEDIQRYEALCTHHIAKHAPVHSAAISKVRSVVSLLWPRAQVMTSSIPLMAVLIPLMTVLTSLMAPRAGQGLWLVCDGAHAARLGH